MGNIDVKNVLMGILASLCGYIFYGHIQLKSDFQSYKTSTDKVVEQHDSELNDIWGKYNDDIEKQFEMMEKFMEFKSEEIKNLEELRKELLEFKIQYYREKPNR